MAVAIFSTLIRWFLSPLAYLIFYVILGYEEVNLERSIKEAVVIMYPHSSYWDGAITIVWFIANPQLNCVGIFHSEGLPGWAGWFFGMILYDPKKGNFVKQISAKLRERKCVLFMAPEGDIRKLDRIKTGFYFIAKEANYPIIACLTNVKERILEFSNPFDPSNKTKKQAIDEIGTWYRQRDAKNKAYYPDQITAFTCEPNANLINPDRN